MEKWPSTVHKAISWGRGMVVVCYEEDFLCVTYLHEMKRYNYEMSVLE